MHLDRELKVIGHRVLRLARDGRDRAGSGHLHNLHMFLRVLGLVVGLRPVRLIIVIARITLYLSQITPHLLGIIHEGSLVAPSSQHRDLPPLLLFDLQLIL